MRLWKRLLTKQNRFVISIGLLLIVAWLGARGLNADAFWYDEAWSYQTVGGSTFGQKTPAQVLASINPVNALGYPLLLNRWGRVVGWSEAATRYLSLLAGVLATAAVYRAGRDLFGNFGGVTAAVTLGTSAIFVHFLHETRAYAMGMMMTSFVLLAYWRLISRPPFDRTAAALLVVGALGMLYTHYLMAALLSVLALYHLLFVPKTKEWWQPVLLAIPVAVLFIPAMQQFLSGVETSSADTRVQALAMSPPALIASVLRYAGNGSVIIAVILLAAGVMLSIRGTQAAENRYVVFMTIGSLLLLTYINEAIGLVKPGRERYVLGMWLSLSLVVGGVGAALWRWRRAVAGVTLTGWFTFGMVTTLYADILTVDGMKRLDWHALDEQISTQLAADDVLVLHAPYFPWGTKLVFDLYLSDLPIRAEILESLPDEAVMTAYLQNAQRVWLGIDQRYPSEPKLETFRGVLAGDFAACEGWQFGDYTTLALYARKSVFCPSDEQSEARLGDGLQLVRTAAPQIANDVLRLNMQWRAVPGFPLRAYSMGVYLMDGDRLAAQYDTGFDIGRVYLAQARLPLADVPPGEYQLMTVVYNWQTGNRLPLASTSGSLHQINTVQIP